MEFFDIGTLDEEEEEEGEDSHKVELRAEITKKMCAVDKLFIDLSEDEIDEIQDILEDDIDDYDGENTNEPATSSEMIFFDAHDNTDTESATNAQTIDKSNDCSIDFAFESSDIPMPMTSKIEMPSSDFTTVCILD